MFVRVSAVLWQQPSLPRTVGAVYGALHYQRVGNALGKAVVLTVTEQM